MDPKISVDLRNILANLYPDESSIRRIIAHSGIDPERVALNSTSIDNWNSVLEEAEKTERVEALLGVVELEFEDNWELRKACDTYRQSANYTGRNSTTYRQLGSGLLILLGLEIVIVILGWKVFSPHSIVLPPTSTPTPLAIYPTSSPAIYPTSSPLTIRPTSTLLAITPTPTPDFESLVKTQLDKLARGKLLFNPPDQMTVGESERIEVRIKKTLSVTLDISGTGILTSGLTGRGIPIIEPIKVGIFMQARLTGDNFKITSLTEEEQIVSDDSFTQWAWDVVPIKSGSQNLNLTIDVRIIAPGNIEKSKTYAIKDKLVTVHVNPVYSIREFITAYWQWLATSIFASVIGWLFLHSRNKSIAKQVSTKRASKKKAPKEPKVIVNTEGGIYIAGNVNSGGEFIGRDKSENINKE